MPAMKPVPEISKEAFGKLSSLVEAAAYMRWIVIRAATENIPIKDLLVEDPGRVHFCNDVIQDWIRIIEARAPKYEPH